jgi:predicted amidohydrolase YtcJ
MKKILFIGYTILLFSCKSKTPADLIIHNARVYTVDSAFSIHEAIAIKEGKILATGTSSEILDQYEAKEKMDAGGKFIYPGFIDAHAHFYNYGFSLQRAQLEGTSSWEEVLDRLKTFAAAHPDGWLTGRGWDQNDWPIKEFPTKQKLDSLFPDRPVIITRIDGHAAIANQRALDMAGVKPGVKVSGGDIEIKNGMLTGVLVDNAVDLVSEKIPGPTIAEAKKALLEAQANCFASGLTTVDDCGISYRAADLLDSLHKTGDLKMKIYAMLSDAKENYEYLFRKGKIKTGRLNIRSFKVYADGALGSRGACLLEPYTDKPGWRGFLLSSLAHFDSVTKIIAEKDMQICTHAIGDSGNRAILNIYARYLKGKNDKRWRIEHAQVVNKNDFDLFGQYNIIPSVQPTHATSDMYWAEKRLGPERVKGAYAFNDLLKQNGWIPLGTDFPVEDISPLKTFYAAVARKDSKGWPEKGFQTENALTRQQTLRGMTIWAARSNFEENEKGSLEKNKSADLIILGNDLMTIADAGITGIKVLYTFVNGEKVFQHNQ